MKPNDTRRVALIMTLTAALSVLAVTHVANQTKVEAQQPVRPPRSAEQAFKNIQVIKSMPASQLQGAMSFMAASLGVDCSFCHTPPAMEKDEKPPKLIA